MTNLVRRLSVLFVVVALAAVGAAAQATVPIDGTLVDDAGAPLAGYRVVFRNTGTVTVFLSEPVDPRGVFRVDLPEGQGFLAVAVIDPGGLRMTIDDSPSFMAAPGVAPALVVAMPEAVEPPEEVFPGADRLFLSFVEDSAIVAGQRYEGRLDIADAGDGELWVSSFVAAVQLPLLPRVELGGRVGLATLDVAGRSGSGLTDTDLWAKFLLGRSGSGRTELAVGALATLPTGDDEDGIGFDALRSELFGAARFAYPSFVVTATAGVRVNEDGTAFGVPLEGEVAPAVGAGIVYPLWGEAALIGEVRWEGERFRGGAAAGEALVGVNWRPLPHGAARLAAGAGLDDGAPDWRIVAGYAFEF